jgi:hypothetical protein
MDENTMTLTFGDDTGWTDKYGQRWEVAADSPIIVPCDTEGCSCSEGNLDGLLALMKTVTNSAQDERKLPTQRVNE